MRTFNSRALENAIGRPLDDLNPAGLDRNQIHQNLIESALGVPITQSPLKNSTELTVLPSDVAPLPQGGDNLGALTRRQKADGSTIELRDGLVVAVRRGNNSIQYEYVQENGRAKLDAAGNPVLAAFTTRINGFENRVVLGSDNADLQSRMQVCQSGDTIGNMITTSADGRSIRTLRTDFSEVNHEVLTHNGQPITRVTQIRRPDNSIVDFAYARDNPTRLMQFTETYHTIFGETRTVVSNRIGDSDRFIAHRQNSNDDSYLTGVSLDQQGRLAFRELREQWFEGDRGTVAPNLEAAREELIRQAVSHGVFRGNEEEIRRWLNSFEQRIRRTRQRHPDWVIASDSDMAESFTNLTRIFTDTPTGIATRVTAGERRLAVECALRELADPIRYINQGALGTCYLNHCEDATVQRLPQHFTRVLRQVLTTGQFTSVGVDSNGRHRVVSLSEAQLHYVPTHDRTYSNQLFQFAAMAALGYRNPHHFPGTTTDQANYVKRLMMGNQAPTTEQNVWVGPRLSHDRILRALRNGVVAYIIPGHAMSIVDYDPVRNMYLVNNWWGGGLDGWYRGSAIGITG